MKLPETEPPSEYINGKVIQKHKPQGEHSVIQTELAPAINLALKPKKIARAFTELLLLAIALLFLIFLLLFGIIFLVKKMEKLLIFLLLHLIRRLRFFPLIKVKPK